MKLILVTTFLLSSLIIANANATMRCLVEPKSVKNAVKRSTAVFTGEVLEIRTGRNYLEARFRVERFWKGVETQEVIVLFDNAVESPHYKVGETYLIFAGTLQGKLFTGNCSRTRRIEHAQADFEQLGEGKSPTTDEPDPI